MVTTMTHWTDKYSMPLEFMANFLTEQEFIDHMFIWMIYTNYGIMVSQVELHVSM